MALSDIIIRQNSHGKITLTKERFDKIKEEARQYVSYWREYPDMLVDFYQTGWREDIKPTFQLMFYQRIFLRVGMRYKYVFACYPRAYSKSFLSVLIQVLRCILYPGAQLFTTAGGKEQAATILSEKITDICNKIPAIKREIDWGRGRTKIGDKDYCCIIFKNGSTLENVAARETSRGLRKHAGLLEECVGIDQDMLQQVIIPMMNVSRRCADGNVREEEVLNQSQLYITTAGYKNTYSYNKLIQTLVEMILDPEKAFVMGGTWRVPVMAGLQPRTFVRDLQRDPTFNAASFEREYESIWSGTIEDAFFDNERFDRNRTIRQAEYEYSGRSSKNSFYIISVDVARRKGCESVATVIKTTPQPQGPSIKQVVMIYVKTDTHFEDQAIWLKKLFYKYKAKRLVIDANGIGHGLVDYLVKPTHVDDNEILPDFGVLNDPDGEYKRYRTVECEHDALYLIKANPAMNTQIFANVKIQIDTGKVKFLMSERDAKYKLDGTKVGQAMTPEERMEYLRPFVYTSVLREEINWLLVSLQSNLQLKTP